MRREIIEVTPAVILGLDMGRAINLHARRLDDDASEQRPPYSGDHQMRTVETATTATEATRYTTVNTSNLDRLPFRV